MYPQGGGWGRPIKCGQIPMGMCDTGGTHRHSQRESEKSRKAEESEEGEERGGTEPGRDLFVDYCVTWKVPHNSSMKSGLGLLFFLN